MMQKTNSSLFTCHYKYDGLGRRIQREIDGVAVRYLYDNEDVIMKLNDQDFVLAIFTHGPGIDEPLSMEQPDQTYFYHADGLGSIRELSDSTGAVVKSYTYDSFGNIVDQTGSVPNFYAYTGREYDFESGLYYYRARYYDPGIGRFLREDPLRGNLRAPQTLNLYPYTSNNPLVFIDPLGLVRWWDATKAGMGIVGKHPTINNYKKFHTSMV